MKAGEWQSNNLVKIHGQFCTANMRENKTNEKAQRRYAAPLHKEPSNVVCLLKLKSSFKQIIICLHLMYRSSLSKKLKPAKRAWKRFTSNLQSKLQSLNVPKTLKTTTHRFINFCSLHLFIPFKKRFLTRTTHHRSRYNHLYRQYYQQHRRDFEAIFIDNLYSEPISSSSAHAKTTNHAHHAAETSSRGKEAAAHETRNNKQSVYSVEDAWNAVVASSPQLRCVDERADEFIYKFREDMKIQRERSLLEFQEMLARGI